MLCERLDEANIPWAIGASCSLALHGLDVDPHDIDVDTSASGAYHIEHHFRDLVVRRVRFVPSPQIRSHWGALVIDGVQVELIGQFRVLRDDGAWAAPPDVRQLREFVTLDDLRLPVMPLGYVRDAYRLLRKTHKAALIDRWLAEHGT